MSRVRLEHLRSSVARTRVAALRTLLTSPDRTPEIVAAVEALLEDTTPTILSLPIQIGEIRHLAAEVLAATRALSAERQHDVVVLDPGYRTLSPVEIGALAATAGCDRAALDPPGQYAWLRDHGKLERRRLEFHPLGYIA